MKCALCDAIMRKRTATRAAPYRYTLSGLPNVLLSGIDVYRCAACAVESSVIPRAGELHRLIAETLAKRPFRLRGEEIRYLRKHLGVSSKIFAAAVGIAPETLSRAEGNKQPLPLPAEQVLRGMTHAAAKGEAIQAQIRDLARLAAARKSGRSAGLLEPRRFRLTRGHGWREAA